MDDIEAIIQRIRAVPAGVEPTEVYESLKKTFPDLTTDLFFLCWSAATIEP